jgi:thiol-disulfide isomerase/thioredoxin
MELVQRSAAVVSSSARFVLVLAIAFPSQLPPSRAEEGRSSQTSEKSANDQGKDPVREGELKEIYKLPEGGINELIAFVLRLRKETTADADYAKKVAAIVAAGHKMAEQATEADRALKDFDEAIGIWLYVAVFVARSEEDRTNLIAVARKHLATSSNVSRQAVGAMMVMIEWRARNPDSAKALCGEFVRALANSEDPQATSHVHKLEGTTRRLTLLGQTVRIVGTAMDGKPIDFAELRGKVVLVDFWATWCGPCLDEVPNMKRNYDLYHEHGFEIIGVSMDEDRDALEQHLAKHPNPWVTLHDPIASEDHVARYYGITSLPTLILIDQQGKAVSVNARGPALGKKLAELLGSANANGEAITTK